MKSIHHNTLKWSWIYHLRIGNTSVKQRDERAGWKSQKVISEWPSREMRADHWSSRRARWTPPTQATGRAHPRSPQLKASHLSLFRRRCLRSSRTVAQRNHPGTKHGPRGGRAGVGTGWPELSPRLPTPLGETGRGEPPRGLRLDLRQSVSELATHPRSIFPFRRGRGTRARTDGRSWGGGLGTDGETRKSPAVPRPQTCPRLPGRYCSRAAPARRAPHARSSFHSGEGDTAEKVAAQ